MIINAVIESKDGGTLVLDFPRSIYDVYEKLRHLALHPEEILRLKAESLAYVRKHHDHINVARQYLAAWKGE